MLGNWPWRFLLRFLTNNAGWLYVAATQIPTMRAFGTPITPNRPAGSRLSHEDRIGALCKLDAGKSAREVARELGCSARTIHRLKKRHIETNSIDALPRSGRPKILSNRDQRHILRLIERNPTITYAALIRDIDAEVSHDTVY